MEVRCHGRLTAFRIGTIRRANQRRVNTLISGRLQAFRRGDRTCRQRTASVPGGVSGPHVGTTPAGRHAADWTRVSVRGYRYYDVARTPLLPPGLRLAHTHTDRKSTRLNSSH